MTVKLNLNNGHFGRVLNKIKLFDQVPVTDHDA